MQSFTDEKRSEIDRSLEEKQQSKDLDRSSSDGSSGPKPKKSIGERYRAVTDFLLKWGVETHG